MDGFEIRLLYNEDVDITEDWIGGTAVEEVALDETYGLVYQMVYTPGNGNSGFKMNIADASAFTNVFTYVYNGSDANANFMILNAGGSWTGKQVLTAGQWTKIEINLAELNDSKIIGVVRLPIMEHIRIIRVCFKNGNTPFQSHCIIHACCVKPPVSTSELQAIIIEFDRTGIIVHDRSAAFSRAKLN